MQVRFLGGASNVGASCIAIEIAHRWIIVDAGVRVDKKSDPLPDLALLEGIHVQAIFITHAHADHIGALPLVHQAFPSAPIYTSKATGVLMNIMLADALKIMEKRAVEEMELPLYSPALVASMLNNIRYFPHDTSSFTIPILPEVTIYVSRAGHIAGAISLGFAAPDGNIVISGDISISPQRTVLGAIPPALPSPVDLLILESTYGARLHPNRTAEEQRFVQAVAHGIERGGHVLIPCFGLGRGQEVLLILQAAQEQGQIPLFPIYVDGLVRKVCAAYQALPEALTPRLSKQIRRGYQPFTGPTVNYIRESSEREQLLAGPPACILASSGMLTGGPSVWYARRLVSDPTASILITGYQDEEAPGKKLLDAAGKKNVLLELGTHQICVACTIEKYSLSAHADGGELASYAEHLRPRRIALVHGDEQARSALQQLLQRQAEILLPQDGETLAITEKQSPLSSPARNPLPLQELPQNIGRGEIFNASHLPILWQALHTLPSHSIFTIRDLVSVWYGSTTIPEYSWWMEDVLEEQQPYDEPYFARITSLPETYRLCEFHQEEQETHLAHLPGLIVLLESHPYAAKPVLIRAREAENIIRVLHPHGEWDKHLRYPLKRIKEIIGPLTLQEEGKSERTQLTNMTRAARHLRKSISAHAIARQCEEASTYTLTALCERANVSPNSLEARIAVATVIHRHPQLFVRDPLALKNTRGAFYRLAPQWKIALQQPEEREHPDQQWIHTILDKHLGNPSDLVRRSINPETGDVVLIFDFPQKAQERYQDAISAAAQEADVSITISPQEQQKALIAAVHSVLPPDIHIQGNPSLLFETRTIRIRIHSQREVSTEEAEQISIRFRKETTWSLCILTSPIISPSHKITQKPHPLSSEQGNLYQQVHKKPLNQQEALTYARELLSPLPGYRKIGIELQSRTLCAHFNFPDAAGEQHLALFLQVEAQTGWKVRINPSVRQEALANLALQLLPDVLVQHKTASIYQNQRIVRLRCKGNAATKDIEHAQQSFLQQTGWMVEYLNDGSREG